MTDLEYLLSKVDDLPFSESLKKLIKDAYEMGVLEGQIQAFRKAQGIVGNICEVTHDTRQL